MLPVEQFKAFIAQNNLFTAGNKVLAAVSGGMDSVIMAHLLKAAGFNFSIAHCNFQLRGDEALADEQFCCQLAAGLGVGFHTIHFDTKKHAAGNKISVQMAARDLRYQWFDQLRQQHAYDVVALAHHQNDAIETILLNLTRGTGIAGLHGILPVNGSLVRPLLFLNRDEIEALIKQNQLAYVEDSSNASVKYARNKLRHEVIPKLKELNPNLEKTFEQNLRHFRDMETLLELRLAEVKNELFVYHNHQIHLSIAGVKALKPQSLLLFNLLHNFGFNQTSVNDIIASLHKHSGRSFESAGFVLLLDRDKLIISPKTGQATAVSINEGDSETNYAQYKVNLLHDDSPLVIKSNPMAVAIDSAKLIYPLSIRPWQQGDLFYPLGMKTRKKLSDFFIQQKIPLNEKSGIPILVNGNGDIMWIAGHRLSELYKVNDNTKKVTIFELIKN